MNSMNTKNGNTSRWNSSTPILTRFRFVSHYLRQIHDAIKSMVTSQPQQARLL